MNEFKVTYYVGAMLAQGGVLEVRADGVVFAPRALERAMGAVDVVIPFDKIKMVEVSGTITEFLFIRTYEKAHRFVGSDLYNIRDVIHTALQSYQMKNPANVLTAEPAQNSVSIQAQQTTEAPSTSTPKPENSSQCPACSKVIQPEFNFCPFCQKSLKPVCPKCGEPVQSEWKFCASCGTATA